MSCDWCEKDLSKTSSVDVCAGCESAYYCDEICQVLHWQDGNHGAECIGRKSSSRWIQKAHLKKGAFTKQAKAHHKSVHEYAEEHKHDSGKLGRRARLALTFQNMH
jgi:hypothetical protein